MNDLPVVRSPWRILILVLGFTFLYAPMLMLVIYSFNSSKLVTVWAGWSTRWYSELFHDDAMMSAVGLSLTIAACAATAAAILGTIAAVVMVALLVLGGFLLWKYAGRTPVDHTNVNDEWDKDSPRVTEEA